MTPAVVLQHHKNISGVYAAGTVNRIAFAIRDFWEWLFTMNRIDHEHYKTVGLYLKASGKDKFQRRSALRVEEDAMLPHPK